MDGLRRANGGRTDSLVLRIRGVKEVGDNADAAALKLDGLRILGRVNEILRHRLDH